MEKSTKDTVEYTLSCAVKLLGELLMLPIRALDFLLRVNGPRGYSETKSMLKEVVIDNLQHRCPSCRDNGMCGQCPTHKAKSFISGD